VSKDHQLREFIVVPSERYPATRKPVPFETVPAPLPAPTQTPPTEKHPLAKSMPFANVLDAFKPVTFRYFEARPPENVEVEFSSVTVKTPEKVDVAVVVAIKLVATTSPTTENFRYGEDVPIPIFPVSPSTIKSFEFIEKSPPPDVRIAMFDPTAGAMFISPVAPIPADVKNKEPSPA